MTENIELMMPIKATPYDHQKRAFAFACDKFGVFDERLKSRGTAAFVSAAATCESAAYYMLTSSLRAGGFSIYLKLTQF